MLILANTTDKLQVKTSAGSTVDVHASWTDLASSTVTPGRTNTAITTAATTDVVAAPASSTYRNIKTLHIRNKDTLLSNDITVQYNQNGTVFELHKCTLRVGESLEYIEGIGFFVLPAAQGALTNENTSAQSISTTDLYLTGSAINIPSNLPVVGTCYRVTLGITKTAGTAAPVVSVRFGTNGSTADSSRCAFTLAVGSSATDTAMITIICVFRTVGTGTSAVIEGNLSINSTLASTGFQAATPVKVVETTGGGFDSTVANSIIGVSFNGSTAFAGSNAQCRAELIA